MMECEIDGFFDVLQISHQMFIDYMIECFEVVNSDAIKRVMDKKICGCNIIIYLNDSGSDYIVFKFHTYEKTISTLLMDKPDCFAHSHDWGKCSVYKFIESNISRQYFHTS